MRRKKDEHRKHGNRHGDEAVGELDERMEGERGSDAVLVPRGPIRTTKPRAGQPYRAAGDDEG
jgi:hypothetical protein